MAPLADEVDGGTVAAEIEASGSIDMKVSSSESASDPLMERGEGGRDFAVSEVEPWFGAEDVILEGLGVLARVTLLCIAPSVDATGDTTAELTDTALKSSSSASTVGYLGQS